MNRRFVSAMARRELRGSGRRLALYGSCMALGIAALVALSGLRGSIADAVAGRARALMGADLMLRARTPFSEPVQDEIAALTGGDPSAAALVTSFASMALAETSGRSRLVHVQAVEPGFPFYGKVVTDPPEQWSALGEGRYAIVDPAVLIQLDTAVGETLKVGRVAFTIRGRALKAPGTFGLRASVAPRVFIPAAHLAATGLVQQGSMVEYLGYLQSDVDLDACRARGILVLGTNEDHPDVDVFSYSGPLCMKMLFEAGIELHKSTILIVSSDKFGRVIRQALARVGAEVSLAGDLRNIDTEQLSRADALVVADYTRCEAIIGPGGDIETADLVRLGGHVTVIQFAGQIDAAGLVEQGVAVYPGANLPARRMSMTLGALGPRPVIELHAAGLKVGEAIARAFLERGLNHEAAVRYALEHSPAQQFAK